MLGGHGDNNSNAVDNIQYSVQIPPNIPNEFFDGKLQNLQYQQYPQLKLNQQQEPQVQYQQYQVQNQPQQKPSLYQHPPQQ
eukprot:Pgem_evm1s4417